MQTAFPIVVCGATFIYVLAGVLSMFSRRNLYDQVGQGGPIVGEDRFRGSSDLPAPPPELPGARVEREREIRQMLQARSDRLVCEGRAPLDIDAELAMLESTGKPESRDTALLEEVRQLVIAGNARRQRQGQHPLDVDAEMQRTLVELNL
jgi:hypothetical protein